MSKTVFVTNRRANLLGSFQYNESLISTKSYGVA